MKNLCLMVMVCVISSLLCYSQKIIDPEPMVFNPNNVQDMNNFLLGWNWGSQGTKLDNALNINSYHGLGYTYWEGGIKKIAIINQD